jgi:hypothetical protein
LEYKRKKRVPVWGGSTRTTGCYRIFIIGKLL